MKILRFRNTLLKKIGGSLALVLTGEFKSIGADEGDTIKISVIGGKIVIEKTK